MQRFTLTEQNKLPYIRAGFSSFKVTLTEPLSISQFISAACTMRLWGDIMILDASLNTLAYYAYCNGEFFEIEAPTINSCYSYPVEAVTAFGGWGRMDYKIYTTISQQ